MPALQVILTDDAGEGSSTVTFDTSKQSWTATNDSGSKLLKNLKGSYVSGTNLYPGFATKGTGLVIDGMSVINKDSLEAYLYNYIPSETVASGSARMLQLAFTGRWKRK
jgi:hypothetical protein